MSKLGQKRGPYKPRTRPRPKTKYAKTVIREQRLAAYLATGMKASDACRKAGFPESVIKTGACQIAKRESVQKLLIQQHTELVEQGRQIATDDLASAAKAKIREGITRLPVTGKTAKVALGYNRTALEMGGLLGGPSELHLHEGHQISPAAARMIAEMVLKIQNRQEAITEEGITTAQDVPLLAEDVQAEPATIKQTEQPQAEPQQPAASTLLADERELLERVNLRFQSAPMARYSNGRRIS